MRWLLLAILVIDLVIVAWLFTGKQSQQEADFVFVCGTAHRRLDPQRMSWGIDLRIAECLFDPLTRIKLPEMVVEPAAAERWQVSEDGRTYTFHIRSDARWSNGDPVKASDFVYAWRRALMPDLVADYSQLLWVIDGAERFYTWRQRQLMEYAAGEPDPEIAKQYYHDALDKFEKWVAVRAQGDKTLVVKLVRPVHYFLQLCAFGTYMPVHQPTVESQTTIDRHSGRLVQDPSWTNPRKLVCNGPYVLSRRRFKRDLLMVANPHYWNRAAMGNQSILELIIQNPANALMLYEMGQVHWLPDIPSSGAIAADLLEQKRDDVHIAAAAGTYFYNFNCKSTLLDGSNNPLADPRVRRALAMGIDRSSIVKNITRLQQRPAMSFTPFGAIPGFDPPREAGASFNPQQARSLLAEAGYDSIRGSKQLKGLSILYNTGSGHEQIAQAIKRTWEHELGVVVKLEGQEVASFGERLKNHDFTIARAGWFGDYRDPTTFLDKFRTDNGNNDAAYSNLAFDRLMQDASSELHPIKRMAILRQAESLMLLEQPIAPIYQYVNFQMFKQDHVKNMFPNPWNYRRLELVEVNSVAGD